MRFHNLVRGLILSNGYILLARERGMDYTFLPGGHIEIGESAPDALVREIREELGCEALVGPFIGCVEADWEQAGARHVEINHLFLLRLPALDERTHPTALEGHLEMVWVPLADVARYRLLPGPLVPILQQEDLGALRAVWATTL